MTESPARLGDLEEFLAALSREPDFDAPELQAYDGADLLLLERAAGLMALGSADVSASGLAVIGDRHGPRRLEQSPALHAGSPDPASGSAGVLAGGLVIIGDRHGALTLGAAHALGAAGIRVHQDPLLSERALAANAERLGFSGSYSNLPLGETLLRGAKLVLLQLPKSLAELEDIAWNIVCFADEEVTVLAGGRDKHMSRGMNEMLSRFFAEVTASRGWRKARVLTACGPLPSAHAGGGGAASVDPSVSPADPRFPEHSRDPDLSFELFAYGATFGGTKLDHGSRLLLRTLREQQPVVSPGRVVDIGCGNGVLAVSAALAYPAAEVIASDQSAAAVAATGLTAAGAGVEDRITVMRADASEAVPEEWADLILLNPPFHAGATVHIGVGQRLIRSCFGAMAVGAELRLVFNSHLGYRQLIEREIGPTRQLARDKTFTVLAAVKR